MQAVLGKKGDASDAGWVKAGLRTLSIAAQCSCGLGEGPHAQWEYQHAAALRSATGQPGCLAATASATKPAPASLPAQTRSLHSRYDLLVLPAPINRPTADRLTSSCGHVLKLDYVVVIRCHNCCCGSPRSLGCHCIQRSSTLSVTVVLLPCQMLSLGATCPIRLFLLRPC